VLQATQLIYDIASMMAVAVAGEAEEL